MEHSFKEIVSVENLLEAWEEFIRGKRKKRDVQVFQIRLMDNILALHEDLINHTYKHGGYQAFKINDPKPRDIHKAKVRDRLLHHAVYRILYPFFDRTFISDSYSCRLNKGSHKAIRRFRKFANKASNNNTRTCWILKCDIRKFFANIDHEILMGILKEYILDKNIIDLLENIIESFHSHDKGIGLPLGNLTSQLFVNIYMNEFDQFVKHKLKAMFYIRYADDFMILSENKKWLEDQMPVLQEFLQKELRLEMHPDKVYIKTLSLGVDFLGWVNFFDHRVLRKSTGKRMAKRLSKTHDQAVLSSYLGILFHGNTEKLVQKFFNVDFFRFLGKNRNVEENTLGS